MVKMASRDQDVKTQPSESMEEGDGTLPMGVRQCQIAKDIDN